jgi:hypothetical protein
VTWRRRTAWLIAVAAFLALEAWLLAGRRSGEVAFQPPAVVQVPSLEIAGASDLTQTFVPGADGLIAVTFVPVAIAGTAPIDLQLEADGSDVPLARGRVEASALSPGTPFTWEVPYIERAAGRRFTLRIASPDAPAGGGLRVAIGPPDYRPGELRTGGRAQWGDLVFGTRAARVHVVDTLRQLRRDVPWPILRTDAALAVALLVLNLAAVSVIWYLVADRAAEPR